MTAQVIAIPPYVGYYQFGDLRLSFQRKPSAWHRYWMRVCLNFVWHDNPDEYLVPRSTK